MSDADSVIDLEALLHTELDAQPLSLSRRFALWYMRRPFSPYVSASVAFDFSGALAYLERINADNGEPRVSIMHLISAAVARVYAEIPVANAMVIGDRIYRFENVGMVVPVNLIGHEAGGELETTAIVLQKVEQRTLREVAQLTRRRVAGERKGNSKHALMRWATPLLQRAPLPLVHGALEALDWLRRSVPPLARAMVRLAPVTVAVSNFGSTLGTLPSGAIYRGAAFAPPDRLATLGTLIGISGVQEDVLVIDGEAQVRPTLPVTYIFDHRLFDGVVCSRILARLMEILADPAAVLGENGDG